MDKGSGKHGDMFLRPVEILESGISYWKVRIDGQIYEVEIPQEGTQKLTPAQYVLLNIQHLGTRMDVARIIANDPISKKVNPEEKAA